MSSSSTFAASDNPNAKVKRKVPGEVEAVGRMDHEAKEKKQKNLSRELITFWFGETLIPSLDTQISVLDLNLHFPPGMETQHSNLDAKLSYLETEIWVQTLISVYGY
jgi:hypothetical protein